MFTEQAHQLSSIQTENDYIHFILMVADSTVATAEHNMKKQKIKTIRFYGDHRTKENVAAELSGAGTMQACWGIAEGASLSMPALKHGIFHIAIDDNKFSNQFLVQRIIL